MSEPKMEKGGAKKVFALALEKFPRGGGDESYALFLCKDATIAEFVNYLAAKDDNNFLVKLPLDHAARTGKLDALTFLVYSDRVPELEAAIADWEKRNTFEEMVGSANPSGGRKSKKKR